MTSNNCLKIKAGRPRRDILARRNTRGKRGSMNAAPEVKIRHGLMSI